MDQAEIDRVLRTVRRLAPKHLDAEDIAIWIVTQSWIAEIEHASYRFIQRRVIDAVRKDAAERRRIHMAGQPERTPNPSTSVENLDLIETLAYSLGRNEKKAIWYHYFLELPMLEVSKRMRCSKARVWQLIDQGLTKMRRKYEDDKEEKAGAA